MSIELPPGDELDSLRLSPEVAWFLLTNGYDLPSCPPAIKTPEPRDYPGAVFSPDHVLKVLRAFASLQHVSGEWAGKPFILEAWQVAYLIAPVFGWLRPDTRPGHDGEYVRIITDVYVDVPRKNGKSMIASGFGIYMACADGEQGAQVVCAATSEKQAWYVFDPIKQLAQKSPKLRPHVKPLQKAVLHPKSASRIEVVSNVADSLHGGNIHASIVDELHVHKNGELVEALETGRGSRRQPISLTITTADTGAPHTVYARKRKRVEDAANGHVELPTLYGVVWAAGPEDDPYAESTWHKANPNLGVSVSLDFLRSAADTAKTSPVDYASFLRLHLGLRTKQSTRFITLDEWDAAAVETSEDQLNKRVAFGGLDLSSVSDFSALAWVFPLGDGRFHAVFRLWLPESQVDVLDKRTDGAVSAWVRDGHVMTTPGDTVDYEAIRAQLAADREAFQVREVGFDRWNSSHLVTDLQGDGARMVEVGQGFASQSPALKEVKRLLMSGGLSHDGNPAVRWMVDNLAVSMDPAGNVKPDKKKSAEKIDAVSALTTAHSRAMTYRVRKSAYAD